MALHEYLKPLPFCAVLRGITPQEIPAVADALVDEGFRILEVPLNSPQPFESIRLLAQRCKDALVGAGTVLRVDDVARVRDAGGNVIVMPHGHVELSRHIPAYRIIRRFIQIIFEDPSGAVLPACRPERRQIVRH